MVLAVPPGSLLESSDAELVEAACRGERGAYDVLIGRHGPRLGAVVRGMVEHPQDAEDIVQEVLLRAWRAMPGFRGEACFSTWLHRIAVNAALDFRRRPTPPAHETIDVAACEAEHACPLLLDPGPEQRLQRDQMRRDLIACIGELSRAERDVFVLRDLEDAGTAPAAARGTGTGPDLTPPRATRLDSAPAAVVPNGAAAGTTTDNAPAVTQSVRVRPNAATPAPGAAANENDAEHAPTSDAARAATPATGK